MTSTNVYPDGSFSKVDGDPKSDPATEEGSAKHEIVEGLMKNNEDEFTPSGDCVDDSLSKMGQSSYYYAHAHKSSGPKWNGKQEPQLLGKTSTDISVSKMKAAIISRSNITKFQFLDEPTKAKIYIPLPGVGNIPDSDILLNCGKQDLCLIVEGYIAPEENKWNYPGEEPEAKNRCLYIPKLFQEIEADPTYVKKKDEIIITLTKREFWPWAKLSR